MIATLKSGKLATLVLSAVALMLLSGCGLGSAPEANGTKNGLAVSSQVVTNGRVHGGQQPVTGASIQLWGVGTTGYGSSATSLLNTPVTTSDGTGVGGDSSNADNTLPKGYFTITNDYSCPASDLVYMTSAGGNPGMTNGTNNTGLVLVAALGSCSNMKNNANTYFINMDEVTTVAAVWALSPFMSSYTAIGAPATNSAGLVRAFASAAKLASVSTGTAPGSTLPANATAPIAAVNTLANILASCVNSAGGQANDGSNCGKLYFNATVGSSVPTNTAAAALNIARHPTNNVSSLFSGAAGNAPFQPTLPSAPTSWLLGVSYIGGGLSAPNNLAIDGNGNIWLTNPSANSVSEFDHGGNALSGSTGFTATASLAAPTDLAIDLTGIVWVMNKTGNNLVELNSSGALVGSHSVNMALSQPSSLSIDGRGYIWIASTANSSVSEIDPNGNFVGTYSSVAGLSNPSAIIINAH